MPSLTNLDILSRPDGGNLHSTDSIPVRRSVREKKRVVFGPVERVLHNSAPGNVTFTIFVASRAYKVEAITIFTRSGTVTGVLKIGTTGITGPSALSVTSTPQTVACTAANVMAAGDLLNLTCSAGSTPLDLHATVKLTLI